MSELDGAGTASDAELHLEPGDELDNLTDGFETPDADGDLDNLDPGEDEDELEDYEIEGHKLSVPKSVKEALEASRLRHEDYTRKTMATAEERKAVEAERVAVRAEAESSKAFIRENARLVVLDEALAQFERVDWEAALSEDQANGTQRVTAARMELERIRDERAKVAGDLAKRSEEQTTARQQEIAKLVEAREADLRKEFPTWEKDYPAIEAFAKANGVTDEELKSSTDPRIFKLLKFAKIGFEIEQKRRATTTIEAVQQVKPVPALNAARKGAPTPRDQDRMSTDDWMKMERQRLAKKSGRSR